MKIDFYLLKNNAADALWLIACRILEKAYRQQHQVYVFCENQQDAEYLDELLWTFKPDSFIPHHIQGEGPEPPPPIQIGYDKEPRGFNDILLNLSLNVPIFYTRFKRIIEIVPADETKKMLSREHFRVYQNAGIKPNTHEIA
ncbi:MAG TPA: DNA polymerase III subunit chi [Legionellaceae bacterium]|nr:DNA polymerase III subunit chi [Legionellaceae bacterium]